MTPFVKERNKRRKRLVCVPTPCHFVVGRCPVHTVVRVCVLRGRFRIQLRRYRTLSCHPLRRGQVVAPPTQRKRKRKRKVLSFLFLFFLSYAALFGSVLPLLLPSLLRSAVPFLHFPRQGGRTLSSLVSPKEQEESTTRGREEPAALVRIPFLACSLSFLFLFLSLSLFSPSSHNLYAAPFLSSPLKPCVNNYAISFFLFFLVSPSFSNSTPNQERTAFVCSLAQSYRHAHRPPSFSSLSAFLISYWSLFFT